MKPARFSGEATVSWLLTFPDGGIVCLHVDGALGDLERLAAGQKVRVLVETAKEDPAPAAGARPLAKIAGMWCRDRTFVRWLMGTFPGRWQACRGKDDADTAAKLQGPFNPPPAMMGDTEAVGLVAHALYQPEGL